VPDAGSVVVDGVALSALDDDARTRFRRERVGFVFQAFHVLPYLPVGENVALPLALNGVRDAAADPRVAALLDAVAWAIAPRARRASCRAASCSASRSRARWCTRPPSCSPTSRPATSTRARPRRSSRCCATP
jgi:ABC-type glutathione transport system ATPase component